jgi:hypothetical protein
VKSPIDGVALDGVPSIRVHNGTNYVSDTKFIRWTEVFLIQVGEGRPGLLFHSQTFVSLTSVLI